MATRLRILQSASSATPIVSSFAILDSGGDHTITFDTLSDEVANRNLIIPLLGGDRTIVVEDSALTVNIIPRAASDAHLVNGSLTDDGAGTISTAPGITDMIVSPASQSGSGIDLDFSAGSSSGANGSGGNWSAGGGSGNGTGNGGQTIFSSGQSGTGATGNSGDISFAPASPLSTNGSVGNIKLEFSNPTGTGIRGQVRIGVPTTADLTTDFIVASAVTTRTEMVLQDIAAQTVVTMEMQRSTGGVGMSFSVTADNVTGSVGGIVMGGSDQSKNMGLRLNDVSTGNQTFAFDNLVDTLQMGSDWKIAWMSANAGAANDTVILRDAAQRLSLTNNTLALLKFGVGTPAAFTAAADTNGTDIIYRIQSGGAHTVNNPRGANYVFIPGVAGSGGTGNQGEFIVERPTSVTTGNVFRVRTEIPADLFAVSSKGNVVIGSAALATTATDGFFYLDSCAGVPTGVPTTHTGRVPLAYDTTNSKLMAYNASWQEVGTGGSGGSSFDPVSDPFILAIR
jgi:hypothetical protein